MYVASCTLDDVGVIVMDDVSGPQQPLMQLAVRKAAVSGVWLAGPRSATEPPWGFLDLGVCVLVNSFNRRNVEWEPVVEPTEVDASVAVVMVNPASSRRQISVAFACEALHIDLTSAAVASVAAMRRGIQNFNASGVVAVDGAAAEFSPYILKNESGACGRRVRWCTCV